MVAVRDIENRLRQTFSSSYLHPTNPFVYMRRALGLFLLLILSACAEQPITNQSNLRFFPDDYAFVLKANTAETLWSGVLENKRIHPSVAGLGAAAARLQSELSALIPNGALTVAFFIEGRDQLQFLALNENPGIESFFEFQPNETYDNLPIGSLILDSGTLYFTQLEERNLISSSELLLEEAIRGKGQFSVNEKIERLFSSAVAPEKLHLVVQPENSKPVFKTFDNTAFSNFAQEISLDIVSEGQELRASGISFASDSLDVYLASFAETAPIEPRLLDHAPRATQALLVRSAPIGLKHPFLDGAIELGRVDLEAQRLLYVRGIANAAIIEALNAQSTAKEDYMGIALYTIEGTDFSQDLGPLGLPTKANYVALYEDAFWFSESDTELQALIKFISSEETFKRSALYASLEPQIAQETSLLHLSKDDKRAHLFAVVKESSHYFTAASSTPLVTPKFEAVVSPILSLSLDAEALTDPQFVKNHYTDQYEIVVQDVNNALYRFSNSGARLWKRQLDAKIQGQIHEIDAYRNKKLQLAFTTETSLVIVDRNGNNLEGFPKRFQDGNLSALSVFDYDNSRNYRLVFSQGRDIYMLNNTGQRVNGFTYTKAEAELASRAKHFRIASKDYLLFPLKNGTLKILQRNGKDRISVKERFEFTSNELFEYRNTFAFIDQNGALVQIDTRGRVNRSNLGLTPTHEVVASNKTLATLDGQNLQIKEKPIELDYGVYEDLRFFYLKDKIYVSLVDKASKQVFLFDSQAALVKGFPVMGDSAIDMVDMDNDAKLEMVVKDERNSLTLYRIE